MDICQNTFRKTLGAFPTGVTVITMNTTDGFPLGITISSFASLSLDPAQILFCLSSSAHSLSFFQSRNYFAVNILSSHQGFLADHFATPATKRQPTDWNNLCTEAHPSTQCPLLEGTMAHVVCQVERLYAGGDHKIIVGEVVDLIRHDDKTTPLIRHLSCYKEAHPLIQPNIISPASRKRNT